MNSVRLQRFLAIYEHRSFGRAAAELCVTQPALTKSIQLLEDALGVKLFERTASGVVPTLYGDALSLHAKVIEAEMKNAAREIATLSGAIKGEVTVGVTPSVAADLLPRAFLRLQAERPGISLKVMEGLMENHVPALRRGELDMVIGGWVRGNHPDLTTEVVMRDRIGIFTGAQHPLAKLDGVPLPALFDYPWVLPPHSQFWVHSLDQFFASHGMKPPEPSAVANSAGFIRAMLIEGSFITALPERLLCHETHVGDIVALPVAELALELEITLTYRTQVVRLPAFNLFADIVRKSLPQAAAAIPSAASAP